MEHKQRTFDGGWQPDADAAGAAPNVLLRCDNLTLDELGVLALRPGSSKINPGAPLSNTDVHSLFTVNRDGTKIRYAAAGSEVYRNAVTGLGLTMAGSGDVAFASHMGQTLFARSTSKYKDDGTTVRNWGIAMTGTAPEIDSAIDVDGKEYASWDEAETAEHVVVEDDGEGPAYDEGQNGDATGAIQLFASEIGRIVVDRTFTVPQDTTTLDNGEPSTDDDSISFWMYTSNPNPVKKTTLLIDVNGGTFSQDFYSKEWPGAGVAGSDGSVTNPGTPGEFDPVPGDPGPGEPPLL